MRLEPIMQFGTAIQDARNLEALDQGTLADIASLFHRVEPRLFEALFDPEQLPKPSVLVFVNGSQVDRAAHASMVFGRADTVTFVPVFAGG